MAYSALKIPTRATARVYFEELFSKTLLFLCVYLTTNWLASERTSHFKLYMDWEKNIPIIPSFILVYMSVYFIFSLPLFTMNSSEIRKMGEQFFWITIIAGLFFLICPATVGYDRIAPEGYFHTLFESLYRIDKPHNLAPSLHISFSTLMLAGSEKAIGEGKVQKLLKLWLILVMFSVVFTHQHHVFDILTGYGLTKWVMSEHFETVKAKVRRGLEFDA